MKAKPTVVEKLSRPGLGKLLIKAKPTIGAPGDKEKSEDEVSPSNHHDARSRVGEGFAGISFDLLCVTTPQSTMFPKAACDLGTKVTHTENATVLITACHPD